MVDPLRIKPEWYGEPAIVAASGPSLTAEVVNRCRFARWRDQWRVMVINDSYRLMPWADVLYAADACWWRTHKGAPEFQGQRYSSTFNCDPEGTFPHDFPNIRLIGGVSGTDFSRDPAYVTFGEPEHSGFQAINLGILLGAVRLVLVGFDYRMVEGRAHFFGDHPPGLRQHGDECYRDLARAFADVRPVIPIVNATPGSRLTKFPTMTLDEALCFDDSLHRHWSEPDIATN